MKNLVLLTYLFCSIGANALVYTTTQNNTYGPYNNSRIGYTTDLHVHYDTHTSIGTAFNSNMNMKRQSFYANRTHVPTSTYRIGYTTTSSYGSNGRHGGPRKSPERPDPDNDSGDDWRMNDEYSWWTRFIGSLLDGDYESYDENWPSYVDADYWDEFLAAYPEYRDVVEEYFLTHPGLPNDPFTTPIGDIPVIGLILISIIYGGFARKRCDSNKKEI